MTDQQHTPEPWRWEINAKHKTVQIVGGVPAFDLTVMDFERWGMGGAVPRFRDTAHGGMNIMHRLCDRPDWIAPFQGREHHADWCANVIHPDARRIVACVNACEGLPTKALEQMVANGNRLAAADFIVDAMDRQIEQAEQQREQLLAALGAMNDEVVHMAFDAYRKELEKTKAGAVDRFARDFVQGLIDRLDAAIAAVKGEMP